MLTSISRGALYRGPWVAAVGGSAAASASSTTSWTRASDYAEERDHLPGNVYVPEGGRRVATADMDPVRHSLMEPDALGGGRHSLLDPAYHAGSSGKAFAGWDPRSFGNSLGSSLREPPYSLGSMPKPAAMAPQRHMPRRG